MQPQPTPEPVDSFAAVYRAHHDFVWRTLRHLGVAIDHVDDALQDTFLVVHRRLTEFEGRSTLRTWLFQIARRVAGRYRRAAVRELPRCCELREVQHASHLEEDLARAEAGEILRLFLEQLDPDRSVVFMMVELEQRRAPEIADALDVNLNTVYARLRSARQQLDRLVQRLQAREQRPRVRRSAQVIAAALLVELPATARAWSPTRAAIDRVDELAPRIVGGGKIGGSALFAGAWPVVVGLLVCGALGVAAGSTASPVAPAARASVRDATPGRDEPMPAPTAPTQAPTITHPVPTPPPIVGPEAPPVPRARKGPQDPLTRELALIEPARAALLAGDPGRATRLLARHRRQFPGSMFAQEVAALHVEALCRRGDVDAARRERAAFARRWPASRLAAWMDSLCGT